MPKVREYRAGALVFFQGEPTDNIYILQKGSVSLVYQDIETGVDVRDTVQPGEFFGVRSALGRYPQEENAEVLHDAAVMIFPVPEFEKLATDNPRLIIKMLQVFSQKLRRVQKQVSSLMKTGETDAEFGLYNMGERYLKTRRFGYAKYVLNRYLTYYPDGKYAAQAAKGLKIAESPGAQEASVDWRAFPESSGAHTQGTVPETPGQENTFDPDGSDPADAAGNAPPALAAGSVAAAYYDALSFITQEKYQMAYDAFKKIVDAGAGDEYTEKSAFDMGRSIFLLNKYDDCIKYYTEMLTKYPEHPELPDILFHVGQSHEKMNRKDHAAAFYKKVITVTENTGDDGTRIKAKRALNALRS